ncbi:hypothetical protein PIB30_093579, partial [Stylosanthes scabra]|nr:hypothetical protein [Stylosanthes scabra]
TSKNFKFGVGLSVPPFTLNWHHHHPIYTQLASSSSKKIQKKMKTENELRTKSERSRLVTEHLKSRKEPPKEQEELVGEEVIEMKKRLHNNP